MRITTGSPPPRDGQIPILSTSIQPSPAAHADLPHQSAGSDSFRKDFLPLLILLLLKTPENEGMLKQRHSRSASTRSLANGGAFGYDAARDFAKSVAGYAG